MMSRLRRPPWPLTLTVPLLVATLTIVTAVVISQIVLSRVIRDQEANLAVLTNAYLDGLSASVLPAVLRGDTWEIFDALDRARAQYSGVEARYTIVEQPNGVVLASSDPARFPIRSTVPVDLQTRFTSKDGLVIDDQAGRAWLARELHTEGFTVGKLLSEIDIANLLQVRSQILWTLLLVNGGLALAFSLIGYFAVRHMLQPLGVLARHVEQVREGRVEAISDQYRRWVGSEFGQLFDRFNAMARSVSDREMLASNLAEQEKYAMLGRLASGIAHEVNNPLGGMMNAIDTIQAHGKDPEVLAKSLDFLKRGLAGIRNVVRATLVTYKGGGETSVLTRPDLDDLPFLVQHETGVRRVRLAWHNSIAEPIAIDGPSIRQITLNLLLNACAASPIGGKVTVDATCSDSALSIVVADEGPGLPEAFLPLVGPVGPVAPPPSRDGKGLGLWTVGYLVRRLHGAVDVERLEVGTRVSVTFPIRQEEARHAA